MIRNYKNRTELLDSNEEILNNNKDNCRNKRILVCAAISVIAFFGICIWKGNRASVSISCSSVSDLPEAVYSEKDRVVKSISLSYFTYGCETCGGLSGTVSELLDSKEMGILIENDGIIRTDKKNRATALFDTSEFIRESIGNLQAVSMGWPFAMMKMGVFGSRIQAPCH